MSSVVRLAPAKINLSLHVLRQRPDGYHDLATRMQKIDLCDRVCVKLSMQPGVRLTCSHQSLASDSNLVCIAANRFLDHVADFPAPGVEITLEKNIPVAAGLGGGSSDAGTTLLALNELASSPLSEEELIKMAVLIGADVPFFVVKHRAVHATGIGDVMEPVADLEGYWIVLINPGFSVSTRSIFENYALTRGKKNSKLASFQNYDGDRFNLDHLHNDLEPITASIHPEIEKMKSALIEIGATAALMSGSGPTTFGLFAMTDFADGLIQETVTNLIRTFGREVYATRVIDGA